MRFMWVEGYNHLISVDVKKEIGQSTYPSSTAGLDIIVTEIFWWGWGGGGG